MAAPIEIIIRQEGTGAITPTSGGTGVSASHEIPTVTNTIDTPQGQESPNQSQVNTLLIDYGKQLMQEGVNTYVDFTGNYLLNDRLQMGVNMASSMLMIGKGGVIGATAVAFNTVNTIVKYNREISRKNQQINFLRNQAGRVVEMGGRYTND